MVPFFAFLLLASDPPQAIAAPSANVTPDFRLAAEVDGPQGSAKAIINISETSTTADGHPWARVYLLGDYQSEAIAFVTYVKFDCSARTLLTEHAWAMDRNLEVIGDREMNESLAVPENSLGAQQLAFMCGGRAAQLQRPYLGSDIKAAIRLADPRFR